MENTQEEPEQPEKQQVQEQELVLVEAELKMGESAQHEDQPLLVGDPAKLFKHEIHDEDYGPVHVAKVAWNVVDK
jgi:hypothetical protein